MRHIVFDTETTALVHNSLQPLHKQPRIFELFGLVLDDKDWSEVGCLHRFYDPVVSVDKKVTEITGQTNETLKGRPKFAELADEMADFMASAEAIAAHNLSYDLSVVGFEFQRLQRPIAFPRRRICTVEATEHIKGYRLKLIDLHEYLFGERFEKAHSAEHDTRALARCYIELHKRGEL